MAVQVGLGDQLIIYLPNRGQTNWSEDFRTNFAQLIAEHDHTGSGRGTKITGQAIAENTIQDNNISFIDLTPTPQTGYVLQWNGSNFVPGGVSASGGISGISAQGQSTIMNVTDTAVTITSNSGSPANTPSNELDFRVNGGKFLIDGSNNSNVLISSAVGASGADPNTKLYIKLGARTTSFNAADKTTWSDLVINNPTDSIGAATGIRLTVDTTDTANQGAGIASVKLNIAEPDADLRFITHPIASSTSRESMRLKDTYNGVDAHTTELTINDESTPSNQSITRVGLGVNTPTNTIDVKTAEDAIITLHNTSESGNDDLSSIQFKNTHATEGDKDWGSVGFTRTDNSALIIETKADNTDGGINLQTNGTGSNAHISLDSHASIYMSSDNLCSITTRGGVEIKAGDHDNAEGNGVNDVAHILLKSGQPDWSPSAGNGDFVALSTADLYLHSDKDIRISTWDSTAATPARQEVVRVTKDAGDFKYKGDFGSATNAYFVRAHCSLHYRQNANVLTAIVEDGFSDFSFITHTNTDGSTNKYVKCTLANSYPSPDLNKYSTNEWETALIGAPSNERGFYTVLVSSISNDDGSSGGWDHNDDVNNMGGSGIVKRAANYFYTAFRNVNGNFNEDCGFCDIVVIRR